MVSRFVGAGDVKRASLVTNQAFFLGLILASVVTLLAFIAGDGFRNLQRGERVEFEIEDTPKGPQAIEVIQLGLEQIEEEEEAASESEAFIPNIEL